LKPENLPQRHRDTEVSQRSAEKLEEPFLDGDFLMIRLVFSALLCVSVPLWWTLKLNAIALTAIAYADVVDPAGKAFTINEL